MKFVCKRCGACCKPGWTVEKVYDKEGRCRTIWDQWATFFDDDISRAAAFLGTTPDLFVDKYGLIDDVALLAKVNNLTLEQYLEKCARKKGLTVDDMVERFPMVRARRLRIKDKQCPFLTEDNQCSIYEVRPKVCASYPTQEQQERLNNRGEHFYSAHCPGFEEE